MMCVGSGGGCVFTWTDWGWKGRRVLSGPCCSESVWSCLTVSADRRLSEVKHTHLPPDAEVIDTGQIRAEWRLNWTDRMDRSWRARTHHGVPGSRKVTREFIQSWSLPTSFSFSGMRGYTVQQAQDPEEVTQTQTLVRAWRNTPKLRSTFDPSTGLWLSSARWNKIKKINPQIFISPHWKETWNTDLLWQYICYRSMNFYRWHPCPSKIQEMIPEMTVS